MRRVRSTMNTGPRPWVRYEPIPKDDKPFTSDDALLDAALHMFNARRRLREFFESKHGARNEKAREAIEWAANLWTRHWHRCFQLTGTRTVLTKRCRRHRLGAFEREAVSALILGRLGLLSHHMPQCRELLGMLEMSSSKAVESMRRLSENGRLHRAKIIYYPDPDEELYERRIALDPVLVESIVSGRKASNGGWPVKKEAAFYEYMRGLTRALHKRSEVLLGIQRGYETAGEIFKWNQKLTRLRTSLETTLDLHPGWRVTKVMKRLRMSHEKFVALALIGKELGHCPADSELFTGGGLARAISSDLSQVKSCLVVLKSWNILIADRVIQPCGGAGYQLSDDAGGIEKTEFEGTTHTLACSLQVGKEYPRPATGNWLIGVLVVGLIDHHGGDFGIYRTPVQRDSRGSLQSPLPMKKIAHRHRVFHRDTEMLLHPLDRSRFLVAEDLLIG